MLIREATLKDVSALVPLLSQLGYPTTVEQFESRFRAILNELTYQTLVAECNNRIIGMIGTRRCLFFEADGTYSQIVMLVVEEKMRRKGIGRELIYEVEKRAKLNNDKLITLNSGNKKARKVAHQFYLNLGFEVQSVGFSKNII
ncbi:GNAT family N-acetyltransferase [Gracilibacillus sp. S3-1-1]|uniref:GNAT family N-acetyltransferase n=1 Tax=Gracilibacillus pellucidus TaxID=3095368 RepID=A0ACC6M6T6_9BACI|nr:GNAT family N-acetyltransferase [Gracilibacillus sp. S3-1-1]MDX8046669.1 GNAT family N-acetyltransferase [Gracilibacillus sp. S3-1-1]